MSVRIERGHMLLLRQLDVADAIDLARATKRLGDARRVQLRREVSESLEGEALPLEVDLGASRLPEALGGGPMHVRARLFAFGVISVVFEVPIADATLDTLAAQVARSAERPELDEHAGRVVSELAQSLGDAIVRRIEPPVTESYAIVLARQVVGDPLSERDALARLLLAEPARKPLAAARADEALARPHRWFEDDLVLLAYDVAFVVEPGETSDLATVIELARTQLLEFRAYDAELDRELEHVYRALARARERGFWLRREGFARAREVAERLVELAELAESADNATKFASDLYLASLYLDALERFRVADWRNGLARKLGLFAHAYELIKGEGDARRATWLELVVIGLIALEMVLAALRM